MKVYDEYSKQQIELQNDILLSLHHSVCEWANDLLRNKYFIVKNSRVYEVEFPFLSILFDRVMRDVTGDVHEFTKNIFAVRLIPQDVVCVDEEEEVSEDAVRRSRRLYPYRSLPRVIIKSYPSLKK